jgi:hypothetical protein
MQVHDRRNFFVILFMVATGCWAFASWFHIISPDVAGIWVQRVASLGLFVALGAYLAYAMLIEDKVPNRLREVVGDVYYGADGLSFMPVIRANDGQAELCVYYQNRYENPAQTIVHMRPVGDSFIIKPGARDVHFAFKAGGGDFGLIHQPIAVPEHLQGEVIAVQLAAVSYYARSKGARYLKKAGIPCGSMLVDWGGSAFKTGVHEVSGEIDLHNPVTIHLSMPKNVNSFITEFDTWRQECIARGDETNTSVR